MTALAARGALQWCGRQLSTQSTTKSSASFPWSPAIKTSRRTRGVAAMAEAMSDVAGASKVVKILGIAGSLRKGSFNAGILRYAAEAAKDIGGVEIVVGDWSQVPLYNGDLEKNGPEGLEFPPEVNAWRDQIKAADGLLFATGEYNYSIPGPLKNAIDWASRPPNVFARKGAAVLAAAGYHGGARAQYHMRQVGVFLDINFLNKPEVFINAFAPGAFDENANVSNEANKEMIRALVITLRDHVLQLQK